MKRLLTAGAVFVVLVSACSRSTSSTTRVTSVSIPSGEPGFPTNRGPTWLTVEGRSFTDPVAGAVSWVGHRRIENRGIN